MPEERARVLAPAQRTRSFKEVVLGLTRAEAVENARIYLERERALKGQPCPLGVDHMALVRHVARGEMAQAFDFLLAHNALPEVTGRLCREVFEETLCQNRRGERVSLRAIERFLAEHVHPQKNKLTSDKRPKIAVIGAGPAGLSASWALACAGYRVTVFDAAPVPGGTLSYAFGVFELPPSALKNVFERFEAAGIQFVCHFLFGRISLPEDLFDQGFAAILIATGMGNPLSLGVADENAGGVIVADDFLKAMHWRCEDPGLWLGPKVLVVGESDSAFSCARIAVRAGREVTVIVRGPETHVQANPMFLRHAIEEGVKIKAFTRPVKVVTGANGCVKGLLCRYLDYRMDGKGRLVMMEDESAAFSIDADTVITAAGWEANTLFLRGIPGLEFNADGSLHTRPEFAQTNLASVFSAGAVVEPAMSLTDAMLAGTRAAGEIDKYLNGDKG